MVYVGDLKQLQFSLSTSEETRNKLEAKVKCVTDEKMSYECELSQLRIAVTDLKGEIAIMKQQLDAKCRYVNL